MKNIPVRHLGAVINEPHFSEGFNIRDVATLLSGSDMVQELHRHSFFYILVLEKGEGMHSIDFVDYPIGKQTVFFMRPGQVHQLVLKSGSSGYLIGFTPDFYVPLEKSASQVLRKVSAKNYCSVTAGSFTKLLAVLANILEEYHKKEERYEAVIRSNLDIFFIELLRQSKNPQKSANEGSEYQQERFEELQELLAVHIAEQKQVSYYAGKLNLTAYQLNGITKATQNKTCSEVINDYIILEARRNLLATSGLIHQIAWELGYEDVSYFIRFFKKQTGYTPDAFRQHFK